jgi:hypothetical protein
MPESNWETGRPDNTWTEKSKADYEALKAKWRAKLKDEPDWLNEPTVSADELDALLDRLIQKSEG